ncbi:hypothetical protein DSO57_1002084 [Entomophthora muscae]|uniref:Uncharacterized protein n=1 Tax=Entomophthora muscae TaxID=34485 RepID=A0ACC2S032_9FUNG|nr:hypothetical protein DSO57_1002084 [Entomophthora muscae]
MDPHPTPRPSYLSAPDIPTDNTNMLFKLMMENFSLPKTQEMGPYLNPEPNSLRSASSGDQGFGCLQPINSIPVSKVNATPPGCESFPTPQSFVIKLPVPNDGSFPKVTTCNTGCLGSKISNPANEESPGPAPIQSDTSPTTPPYTIAPNDNLPAPDARNFPKISTCDTGGLLGKISKLSGIQPVRGS